MFVKYKDVARRLQRVDLDVMISKREEMLSFFINVYNALVIHGTIEKGVPTNIWARYSFFSSIGYNIGGFKFTLNDIENGILRGNRASMATLYLRPFSPSVEKDPRVKFALSNPVEARIHFALNCGAKSCPPIKTFTAKVKLSRRSMVIFRSKEIFSQLPHPALKSSTQNMYLNCRI